MSKITLDQLYATAEQLESQLRPEEKYAVGRIMTYFYFQTKSSDPLLTVA